MSASIPPEAVDPEVLRLANELRDRGYSIVRERYDAASFGDALIVLEFDTSLVRLVRDRGQWFVELSCGGVDDWFAPVAWHNALVGPISPAETLSFSAQAQLLPADLPRIQVACDTLAPDSQVLEELRSAREHRAAARREMPPS